MELFEIGWAAGFFEGEGSFTSRQCWISQVDDELWALKRFQGLFGGQIYGPFRREGRRPIYRYASSSATVTRQIILVLAPHLSPRRRKEAAKLWSEIESVGLPFGERTHCPKGHLYSKTNTYRLPNGGRGCRECMRESTRKYRRRLKEKVK